MTKLNITRQIWPKSNRRTKRSAKREITPYTQANGKRSYQPFVPKTNTHLVICRTRLMKIEPENLSTNEKINKKVNFLSKVALERPRISKSLLNWSKNVHRHKYSAEKERKNCEWVISIDASFFFMTILKCQQRLTGKSEELDPHLGKIYEWRGENFLTKKQERKRANNIVCFPVYRSNRIMGVEARFYLSQRRCVHGLYVCVRTPMKPVWHLFFRLSQLKREKGKWCWFLKDLTGIGNSWSTRREKLITYITVYHGVLGNTRATAT